MKIKGKSIIRGIWVVLISMVILSMLGLSVAALF